MHSRIPALFLLTLLIVACGGSEAPDSQAVQDVAPAPVPVGTDAPLPFQLTEEEAAGRVVYETFCWSCHGSAGRGDGPAVMAGSVAAPRDFTAGALSGASVRQIQARFRAMVGTLDPGHPHMQNVLSVADTAAFESALAYLPALTYPAELPGSAIAGHSNYVLRCQACHGATGQGDGAGGEVLEVSPANFVRDTLLAVGDFQALFEKIRTGGGGVHLSAMPAWGVMLSDGDVWDLVAYIGTFQPGALSVPPGRED